MIILDLKLPDISGDRLFPLIKRCYPDIPVIITTAYGSIRSAVDMIRDGAYDYITKPFNNDNLCMTVKRGMEIKRLRDVSRRLMEKKREEYGFHNLIGNSKEIREVIQSAKRVVDTDAAILIEGESGTGKEILAKAIHYTGVRINGPFIAINCASLSKELMESELFGHEKGAFTDAKERKAGKFQIADKGTIFLDEIGEMDIDIQARLLRVIQDRLIDPVGSVRSINIDVRIISATNKDLKRLVEKGRFREDLYYRISVYPIKMPPLRMRKGDIIPLVEHFIMKHGNRLGRKIEPVSEELISSLQRYHWPGNVRELENVVERMIILGSSCDIEEIERHFSKEGKSDQRFTTDYLLSLGLSPEEIEKKMILNALSETGGNISKAACILKMGRGKLRHKMRNMDYKPEV